MLGEYPMIDEMKLRIKPFEELWKLQVEYTDKLKIWKGTMQNLNPDDIEADHKKMTSAATKLVGRFDGMKLTKPKEVADNMKKALFNFRSYLPIIRALCNPGLMDRHYKMLGEVIFGGHDQSFNPAEFTTESLMTTHKCGEKKDNIEDISDKASKEHSNMKTMAKMEDDWIPLEFTC